MSLKSQSNRPPLPILPTPIWGDLAELGETVGCVRFECGEAEYSFPYYTLSYWILRRGSKNTLEILAGNCAITVHGRGLKAIQAALESSRLRALKPTSERYTNSDESVCVTGIEVRFTADL